VHRFAGPSGGVQPTGDLVGDKNGALYGTTNQGGASFMGTVYRLTPNASHTKWAFKVLFSFPGGARGAFPQGGLAIDADGNLYGTTTSGAAVNANCENGCGTVFKLSAGATATWTETVLYRFRGGADGAEPRAAPVLNGGKLYGTTYGGGTAGKFGIVYRLTRNATGTGWTEAVLYRFGGSGQSGDGGNPEAPVTFLNGVLYGLTTREGIKTGPCSQDSRGCGIAFSLTPPASGTGAWTETVLYRFKGGNDGMEPSNALLAHTGFFFGATHRGGASNTGTIFTVTQSGASWAEKVIYAFKSGTDGKDPQGVRFRGPNVIGTTAFGGSGIGEGTVFQLTLSSGVWHETVLHRFTGDADGGEPQARLSFAPGGKLYGTTTSGGTTGSGTVFELFHAQ
jgi:uncharacterized repeat protein (TIGR03803 family)